MLWIHSFVQIFHVRSHAPFKIERVRSVFGFFFFALIVDAYFYPFGEIGLLAQTFQYLLPVIFRNLVCLAVRKNFRIGLERNGSAVFFALLSWVFRTKTPAPKLRQRDKLPRVATLKARSPRKLRLRASLRKLCIRRRRIFLRRAML